MLRIESQNSESRDLATKPHSPSWREGVTYRFMQIGTEIWFSVLASPLEKHYPTGAMVLGLVPGISFLLTDHIRKNHSASETFRQGIKKMRECNALQRKYGIHSRC